MRGVGVGLLVLLGRVRIDLSGMHTCDGFCIMCFTAKYALGGLT